MQSAYRLENTAVLLELLVFRGIHVDPTAHPGNQLRKPAVNGRRQLHRLADRIDRGADALDLGGVILAGLIDFYLETVTDFKPREPTRRHDEFELEHAVVDDIEHRLTGLNVLLLAYLLLRDTARVRRNDGALGE